MRYLAAVAAAMSPTLAAAHEGLHHHPHGIETVWIAMAVAGAAAFLLWLRSRG